MMDAEYGVGIKNRFAFLGDDDDNEVTQLAVTIKPNKTAAVKKPIVPKNIGTGKQEKKAAVAPTRNGPKGTKGPIAVHEERKGARENDAFATEKASRDGPRGYRRDGPPPNRRNYRARFAEDKEEIPNKETELKNAANANGNETEKANDAGTTDEGIEKGDGNKEEDGLEDAKTVEKTFTLAEWKALQAPREKPVFNIRKPGEGEVSSKLEKLVLKKREDDIENQEEEYETDDVYYPQRAGKMKPVADVGFTTGYQKRRGGGRFANSARVGGGDSNGQDATVNSEQIIVADKPQPRGRNRFGPRGGQGRQRAVEVPRIDDASDFPTLG